jgi:hypothetical protein
MQNDSQATPEPGTDSRVEDWHGQPVDRDARLADELSEELPADEERRLAGVPLTLTAVMGAFLVIAAIVAVLIWAI